VRREPKNTVNGQTHDNAKKTNFLEVAQTLAAYVAIPVALVYPFGFVALFLQFVRYFGLEFYTAWYALSLVNKTIVIGQGATILIVALVGSVLLAGTVGQTLILLWDENTTDAGRFRRRILAVGLTLGFLVTALVLYVLYSRMLAWGRMSWSAIVGVQTGECRDNALRHQLNFWPDSLIPAAIFVLGVFLGGLLIYESYHRYHQGLSAESTQAQTVHQHPGLILMFLRGAWSFGKGSLIFFVRGVTQRWIWSGLLTAYIFGIVASLWLAWATPAFMPYVNFGFSSPISDGQPAAHSSGESETQPFYDVEPPTQPTSDRYLSHAEGHWHFIHRGESAEGKREYRVISLREDQVSYARVVDAGVKGRVAPFPWENPSTWDLEPCSEFRWGM
jgi:hypothetical protein